MKIAICIDQSSLGGVGTSTFILATGMRQAGHQADILATDWRAGEDAERARRDGWPVKMICRGERWLRRRLEITYKALCAYDAVIDNWSLETRLVAPALPVGQVHLTVVRGVQPAVIEGAIAVEAAFHALVAVSPHVADLLRAAGARQPVHLIPNAVMIHGEGRSALYEPLRLGYLGRLGDTQKNEVMLPRIAQACRDMDLEFQFRIAGDGRTREELRAKFRRTGVEDWVRMLGAIRRDEVSDFFRGVSVAVFPSRFEGFGLTLAEAMGVGCVPVASNIPSYRWILGDLAGELTVPIDDASAYARAIARLAADPRRYLELQQRVVCRQQAMFTPESTVIQYLRLIEHFQETGVQTPFSPIPFRKLALPAFERLRCSRLWYGLQMMKAHGRQLGRHGFTSTDSVRAPDRKNS